MDTAFVTLSNGTYEVSRVFSGERTAASLVLERLMAEITRSGNLTGQEQMRYNTDRDGPHNTQEVL